jgi:hypothetical protein
VSNADCLEGLISDGADQAQEMEFRSAEVGAHLTSGRMGLSGTEKAVEKLVEGQPPGDHQGFIPIVQVKPIVQDQVRLQGGGRFMSGSADMKKALTAMDQLHFHPVHFPCQEDCAIQLQSIAPA